MKAPRFLLLAALVVLLATPLALTQSGKEVPLSVLRKNAKRALEALKSGPDRAEVETVLVLVKRLRKERKRSEVSRYLKKLAPLAPDSMPAQLAYAEMLHESRKKKDAERIAKKLLRYGETDAVRLSAHRILGEEVDLTIPPLAKKASPKMRVVLLPMGKVELTLLRAARAEAAQYLMVDVELARVDLKMPKPERPRCESFYESLKPPLRQTLDDPAAAGYCAQLGLTRADLDSEERMIAITRKMLERNPNKIHLKRFEAEARFAHEPMWDANKLLGVLRNAIRPYRTGKVIFIAVTGHDIYANKANFFYGWASTGGWAVVSYNRFRTARSADDPSWELLRDRTVKQIITSCGRTLKMMHCSDPDCVLAGPNNIHQFDMKRMRPCESCAGEFDKRLRG